MASSSRALVLRDQVVDARPLGFERFVMPHGYGVPNVIEDQLPPSHRDFTYTVQTPKKYKVVAAKSVMTPEVHKALRDGRARFLVEDHAHMRKTDGYWCRLSKPGLDGTQVVVTKGTPYVHIPVNLLHFDLGVRFPLHWFLTSVLCHYKVSLNQVTVSSLSRVLGFIWVCEFFYFPLTMDLFQACFRIQRNTQVMDMWSFVNVNNRLTLYPKPRDYKAYLGKFVMVRVPLKRNHPNKYEAPVFFSEPINHPAKRENELQTSRERLAYEYFGRRGSEGPERELPKYWLPHRDIIPVEEYLALGGLSRRYHKCKFPFMFGTLLFIFDFTASSF